MKHFATFAEILNAWTASAVAAITALAERVVSPAVVRLIEQEDGGFRVESDGKASSKSATKPGIARLNGGREAGLSSLAGKRAEIVLLPRRFLFRPLDLPPRAADFLDGIVRAQIDRLTPWNASEAVYGCSRPVPNKSDGITTIIAATTRKAAEVFVQAAAELKPASIVLFADATEQNGGRIKVFEQKAQGHLEPDHLQKRLKLGLAAAAVCAFVSGAASFVMADRVDAQREEIDRQIAQRRAAIRANSEGAASGPLASLERRKNDNAARVIVLEALSRALPDNTFLTELHLNANRLQIAGMTSDAPALISLIERSKHFTRATFYAPTTRAANDPGERFHIEARVEPKNVVTP